MNKLRKLYYRALKYYPATIHGFKFKVDPFHLDFWRNVASGHWEPETYKILGTLLKPDFVYCDIGAWIGPTVIYAAKKCQKVICFEPDPVAYKFLRWNIELNKLSNVTSFNLALADGVGIQKMASFRGNLGDSTTSLLKEAQGKNGVDVVTFSWQAFLDASKVERIDFMKIDIEGGEFLLVPTLKDYLARFKPVVYLSTHAPMLDDGVRKEKVRELFEIISIYAKCLDENLQPIEKSHFASEECLNGYHSYVFMD